MIVALIPCGSSDWHEEGRLLGRVELSLTPAGEQQCREWVERLRPIGLARILHSPDELATKTAERLARPLNAQARAVGELVEVDLGLWTGLTEEQLSTRFSTAHRELVESPLNVNPPDGELFSDAAARLRKCLHKHLPRHGKRPVGFVLRPLAFALALRELEQQDESRIWETAQHAREPLVIDLTRTD